MGIDASIPLQVRAPNLSDLADSYMMAKKFKEDQLTAQANRGNQAAQLGLAKNQDVRAGEQLALNQNQDVREQSKQDDEFKDIKAKRADRLRATMTSILGEEAEVMAGLPPEKRQTYYEAHMIPNLMEHGIDTGDMPEYDDKLIDSWRQMAMSPDERGKYRYLEQKPVKKPTLKYFATPDGQIEFDPETRTSKFVPNPTDGTPAQPIMYSTVVDTDQGKMTVTPGNNTLQPLVAPQGAAKPGEQLGQPIKPLDSSERDKLTQLGTTKRDSQRFLDSFKDEYGGYVFDTAGNFANSMGKTFGDDSGQTQFWQDYQTFLNVERNDLFGSALTPGERVEFHKAIVSPGMDPGEIRKNLQRQVELVNEVTKRKFQSYSSDKRYNPKEIGALLGVAVERKEKAPMAAPPGQTPVKSWEDAWGKKEAPKAASKYKDGDKKVNKDGDNMIFKDGRWMEDK